MENLSDRERWNRKYSEGFLDNKQPSDLVVEFSKLARTGKALDLAAGLGRNSLYLAERGFLVDSVDISDVAIEKLKKLHPNINPIQKDLKIYRPATDSYDLILNINFLERSLFPYIVEALKKDGVLIFETFLDGTPTKTNTDFILRTNELLHSFLRLNIIFYQEKEVVNHRGEVAKKAYLVAKKVC